ncbi:MAG: phosphoglycerate kinase [Bacteroidales bacterium]|nr:phosphoglycerate kinase [Bacteroidales bacterium]
MPRPIDKYDFTGKKALIRVDFNVPVDAKTLEITDDTRIRKALPTIKKVTEKGAAILMSHFGRPKNGPEDQFSMRHIVGRVSELLGKEVKLAPDSIGPEVKKLADALKPGEVLLLENLRFHKGETKNPEKKLDQYGSELGDEAFAKQLSELGDCWINEAFGTAHRPHASTAVIAKFFPNDKMFGYLVEEEIEALDKVLKAPERPLTAIMGGSKISTKIPIIRNLLTKVDNLIIGGGMIFTFVKAVGGKIGDSIHEDDFLEEARKIIEEAKEKGVNLVIATDCVAGDSFSNDAKTIVCKNSEIPDGWQGMDVGPETVKTFNKVIGASKTILWNGPAGVFEFPNFAAGTKAIGAAVVEATKNGAYSLVGGGDSVAAVNQFGIADKVSYISTAGGALLEYLEGRELPGIAAVRS